jgi:hypothetical protein
MQIAPTMDEAKALKMYRGAFAELSPPEQFLLVMASVPRLVNKVQALIFRRQFEGLCGEALGGMETLRSACEQLRGSARLRRVLSTVLAAGNQLNAGTARGSAASLRLDSLLKLNDVKVTAAPAAALAAAAAAATSPRRSGDHRLAAEGQPQGGGSAGAAADGPAAQQANGTAAAAEAAPPPVKTLLEFVAWVVLQQEAAESSSSSSSTAPSSIRSSGSAAAEALGRAVRSGFLAQQLPDLALAVRRMQTDVADSLRGLEDGMKNLQQEFDFELEQQRLKAGISSEGAGSSSSACGGGGGGSSGGCVESSTSPRADRQAAFTSGLEAAAAAGGKQAQQADGQPPADGQQQAAADGQQPELPQFAAVLRDFLATAQQRQAELEAASRQTSALVAETVAWLGEPASEAEQAAVFELLFSFVAGFDHCAKRVHRLLSTAGAAGLPR